MRNILLKGSDVYSSIEESKT